MWWHADSLESPGVHSTLLAVRAQGLYKLLVVHGHGSLAPPQGSAHASTLLPGQDPGPAQACSSTYLACSSLDNRTLDDFTVSGAGARSGGCVGLLRAFTFSQARICAQARALRMARMGTALHTHASHTAISPSKCVRCLLHARALGQAGQLRGEQDALLRERHPARRKARAHVQQGAHLCRKCRPRATSKATMRPRLYHENSLCPASFCACSRE